MISRESIFFFLCLVTLFVRCSEKNASINRMSSKCISSKELRVNKLSNEINLNSKIIDAEFNLFNVNGFSKSRVSLPGASSWDYQFVIKVEPRSVEKWLQGTIQVNKDEINLAWMMPLITHRIESWKPVSTPAYYTRDQNKVILIVYFEDGIIFKRVTSL